MAVVTASQLTSLITNKGFEATGEYLIAVGSYLKDLGRTCAAVGTAKAIGITLDDTDKTAIRAALSAKLASEPDPAAYAGTP